MVSWCLSKFFSLVSEFNLTSMVDPESIPFFLIYTPYRNVFGAVQDLKEEVDARFTQVDEQLHDLKQGDVSALNVKMGLVLDLLNRTLTR